MSAAAEDGPRPTMNGEAFTSATASPMLDKDLPPIPEFATANSSAPPNGNAQVHGNGSALAAPTNGLISDEVSPATSLPDLNHGGQTEADDYINAGQPHGHFATTGVDPLAVGETGLSQASTGRPVLEDGSHGPEGIVESPPITPGPRRRRSVQFSQSDVVIDPPAAHGSHQRQGSWDPANPSRSRQFMSRLKALAVQSGMPAPRTPGSASYDGAPLSTASSPTVARGSRPARSVNDNDSEVEADADADAEETADETSPENDGSRTKRRKRRMYARQRRSSHAGGTGTPSAAGGVATEPNSPLPSSRHLNLLLQRRATMPDPTDHRGGLSEGEGRDHLDRQHGWRRGSSWVSRGEDNEDGAAPSSGRAVGHIRRMTVFGGGVSDGDAMTPRRTFFTGDRAATYGVQKWRQMKNTLKLLRQKKEDRFDYLKSAELMAELRAGAPAVLMLASMIQRDEHGNKRIPVLLEQVKLSIRDSTPVQDGDSERHWLFTIDLEYGSGPSRMKWTIKRTIGEIMELHWKYKLTRNDKYLHTPQIGARPKQPRFPISAFPYVRGLRGIKLDDEEDAASVHSDEGIRDGNGTAGEGTAGEGTATDAEVGAGRMQARRKKSRIGVLGMTRRQSGLTNPDGTPITGDGAIDEAAAKRKYVERQQRMLEKYLNEMVHWLIFRADSNRLCRFLELSALGVRLAAEGSYHGKECFLHIQSSKGLDFRRVLTPGKVINRHSRKWFLVRQSYIVCVESPENMNIYDVYLVDPKFLIISKSKRKQQKLTNGKQASSSAAVELELSTSKNRLKHHTLTLLTSERKVKLWARNQHLIGQFEESIVDMLKQTPWHRRNRFDSFAPVRTGVFAQWLVDGRDYMWNVSRAIAMAKDVIYIHDWWLSPELYMRRPACISQKWRLDRLLQRKASEGVKIFVIIYRNVEAAIPIDSEYTKFSLLNLHPNIFVQRSPNQFKKNQFFFAHHEKICVVDHDVAFVGGIDLCFGRWDSPQHSLVDDKPTGFEMDEQPRDADHTQLWPGKDYSNPRVQDFFSLREPYKEMYDRTKVPRMPWHDVGMQIVGQPARDLTRHFVQRWNYVRRGRKPTRPTPFLLPPPDYRKEDLDNLGLSGTCEVQILRSACSWSLGITDVECSIQTAYISMIEESEHFVYMENQFFITSTETLNVKIVNRIGDALVERIIRAHRDEEDWKCVIIIPLMPGFQNSVADQEGTSVRLILQCQYRSICRGENSIFGRLRAAGIEPEDYIQFFSLRQWGKINNKTVLTTEQLYIHAKVIIADDRVALIGSANINERSMLGDRDSEVAAVVRDRDMIASTMAGIPYRVGRFAHTLRLRLMQEHLGLDTDEIMEDTRREAEFEAEMDQLYSDGGEGLDHGHVDDDRSTIRSDISPTGAVSPSQQAQPTSGLNASVEDVADKGEDPVEEVNASPYSRLQRVNSYNHNVDLEAYGSDAGSSTLSRRLSRTLAVTGLIDAENEAQEHPPDSKAQLKDVDGHGEDKWKVARQKGTDRMRDSTIVDGHEVLITTSFDAGSRDEDLFLTRPVNDASLSRSTGSNSKKAAHTSNATGSHMAGRNSSPDAPPPVPPVPNQDAANQEQSKFATAGVLPPLPVTDDTDIGGPADHPVNPLAADIHLARITKDCMRDPLDPAFIDDVWNRVAENNTKIYRRVFRCLPDSEATNWHEFQEFIAYGARFQESMEARKKGDDTERVDPGHGRSGHNHARHAAGGGAGISVPTPSALNAVAAVGEKVANVIMHSQHLPHSSSSNDRPTTKDSAASEAASGEGVSSSKTEMEKAARAENAFKRRPSSVTGYPGGSFADALPVETDLAGDTVDDTAGDTVGDMNQNSNKSPSALNGAGIKNKNRRTTFSEQEKPPRLSEKDGVTNGGGSNNADATSTSNTTNSGLPNLTSTTTAATTGTASGGVSGTQQQGSVKRRKRATTKSSRRGFQGGAEDLLSRADAEDLLGMMQGVLVQFPYDWLHVEESNGNWMYQVDQVAPLQIYN